MKFGNLLKKASSIFVGIGLTLSPINAHVGCKVMTALNSIASGVSATLCAVTYVKSEDDILDDSLDDVEVVRNENVENCIKLFRGVTAVSALNFASNAYSYYDLNQLHNENSNKQNSKT